MVDIESRLHNASENIKISFVDPEIVLNKAKVRKQSSAAVKKNSSFFKFSFAAVGLTAAVVISAVFLPNILRSKLGGDPGMSDNASDSGIEYEQEQQSPSHESGSPSKEGYMANLKRMCAPIGKFSSQDETEELNNLINNINTFSASVFSNINNTNSKKVNTAFSPVSLYSTLSIISQITDENKKEEVYGILKTNETELKASFLSLMKLCNRTFVSDNKELGREFINNSIWLDNNHFYDEVALNNLAYNYYTSSFWGDFANDNKAMNTNMSKYVYDVTDGYLNPSLNLPTTTSLAMMSNLYFKDEWNEFGSSLKNQGVREFNKINGTVKNVAFYSSFDTPGKIMETEKYKSMFIKSANGFTLDFLVPKDGFTADDLYQPEILLEHETKEYETEENGLTVYSRVLFPEFNASYQGNILKPIEDTFSVDNLGSFNDFATNSETGESDMKVTSIVHTTKVSITSDGLSGGYYAGDEYKGPSHGSKTEEFIVDRPFVYIIKDSQGVTLLNGVIYNV